MSPVRTGCPPLPPNVNYQRHLSSDGKLGAGPENKAGNIQQSFLENCYTQDGMQPLVLQATHFAEFNLLGKFPGSPPHQSPGNEASGLRGAMLCFY